MSSTSRGKGGSGNRFDRGRGRRGNCRRTESRGNDEITANSSGSQNQSHHSRGRHNNGNARNAQDGRGTQSNSNRGAQSNSNRGASRQMGYRCLQDLLKNEDLEDIVFTLSNDKKGFKELLDSREVSNDMIVMLVKLQRRICDCKFPQSKLALFEMTLKSCFIDNVIKFVTSVALQSARDKKLNPLFWNNTDNFWENLITVSQNYHDIIPATSSEAILKMLKAVKFNIPVVENNHQIHVSDSLRAEVEKNCQIVEATSVELEKKKENTIVTKNDQEPPDDFRHISIYPSPTEVTLPDFPFLRPNVTQGSYKSVDHYLDVQFRLLREDFVAPLRKGICKYKNKPKERLENIKIYNPIKFLEKETVTELNCYRIQFDFSQKKNTFMYENSRRFMFGALLCFTHDNFKTLLFGKVVKRDVKDCLELGQLIVGFNMDVILPMNILQINFLMVESTVYFEPYYEVLRALKTIHPESFPMERYIIRVETQTVPPDYLLKINPQYYTIESQTFFPLDWGDRKFYGLNDAQSEAFRAALTKEFAIIQGPPGTGKTFLGLRIAHTLLKNKHVWYKNTPILVICYTNHALDQFLEGLLPVTKEVVRVGGQSKNEKLTEYNIRNKRSRMGANHAIGQRKCDVRDCFQTIATINSHLLLIEKNNSVLKFSAFKDLVPGFKDSWFGSASDVNIYMWLFGGFEFQKYRPRERTDAEYQTNRNNDVLEEEVPKEEEPIDEMDDDNEYVIFDDVLDKITALKFDELINLKMLQNKLNNLYRMLAELNESQPNLWLKMQQEDRLNFEIYNTENEMEYLKMRLHQRKIIGRSKPRFVDMKNPHRMAPDDRWQLYYHWLSLYVDKLKAERENCNRRFRRVYAIYNELKCMEDTQVMKESLVVGMTTTGAARLRSSLQTLKSPIVIVEEAAEVLESHIVSALTAHCKHLILIGDHQQLKPSTADFKIETKYRLGISLFERMVINNIQCHTLNIQHRMRPEISCLVRPSIYPILYDHESVMSRPPVAGVDKCVYFIDHQEEEQICRDNSKMNIHEAHFLIKFARHLILNGYKPENITILAAYLGQMFEMQREKRKYNLQLQDVRIAVLDNYQGEESDIILLSLVRSNRENKIGFLKAENRVCVALSRARNGFYIMGNMTQLCDDSEIWPKVRETLKSQEAIGTHLTLRCQVHPEKLTFVKAEKDFSRLSEGGCDLMCEAKLNCGHICKRLCHVEDKQHKIYKCNYKCELLLCEDVEHKCLKLCFETCGPCTYLVERTLDCGHTVQIECNINPSAHKCTVPLEVKLPCGHETRIPCHSDPVTFRCPFPCDTRVEPCGHACINTCHVRNDPDHLEYKCRKPCDRPLKGCTMKDGEEHKCMEECYKECSSCDKFVLKKRSKCKHAFTVQCILDVDEIHCKKPCGKKMPCGHECKKTCDDPCGNCLEKVPKEVPDCKHIVDIACHAEPDRKFCKGKCPRLLDCGHPCQNKCNQACTAACEVKVDCSIQSPCGHTIEKIQCCFKKTADSSLLLNVCTEKCTFKFDCDHICSGSCGDCSQGRIHLRCQEECGVPLVCDHKCPIPCREACKPCQEKCTYRCKHNKCKKKCGEPCTRCKEKCPRFCNHQRCNKKCWEICDIPPCNKPCPKKVPKCGHDCVGFCGDLCPPLCRICDREELTNVFLGNEDEEDAVYVMLVDCKHIFEASDMDRWIKMDEDQIKPKVCPRCKTKIMKTERYSEAIKRNCHDIMKVKMMYYGNETENGRMRDRLRRDVRMLRSVIEIREYGKLQTFLVSLELRLENVRGNRRQYFNRMDLMAIESKTRLLRIIVDVLKEGKSLRSNDIPMSMNQLDLVLGVLSRDENSITKQEVDDITLEIDRLLRFIQFEAIKSKMHSSHFPTAIMDKAMEIEKLLKTSIRFNSEIDGILKTKLAELSKSASLHSKITDAERISIVEAVGLQKGHWFKCPNGHPYAIGECGGANQVSHCYECKAPIGGSNHRLLPGQRVATEMDGARHPAWSEAMNLENFGLIE